MTCGLECLKPCLEEFILKITKPRKIKGVVFYQLFGMVGENKMMIS